MRLKTAQSSRQMADYVFVKREGGRYTSLRNSFDTACQKAGLKDVTPYTGKNEEHETLVTA